MKKLINKIVFATHNDGKLAELRSLTARLNIEVISAGAINLPEPDEVGTSFAENAILKARLAASLSGFPALADDSGLCVKALDNKPGIYSARWAGNDKNFTKAIQRIETELGEKSRDAYFVCILCLAMPEGNYELFEGRIYGTIVKSPRGMNGFGYDPIFEPLGLNQTFGEMSAHHKNSISHRAVAFEKLVEFLSC